MWTFQSAFGFSYAELARLVQGGKGFVDACYGGFVGMDVEVADCVVDELEWVRGGSIDNSYEWAYSCGIFVEQHGSKCSAEVLMESFVGYS